jgi:hypothetical protein
MRTAIQAGPYFAIVFSIGLLLGTVRVLVVVQRLAQTGAVLFELPMILVASWLACGWLLRRLGVASARRLRLAMGATPSSACRCWRRSLPDHFAPYHS